MQPGSAKTVKIDKLVHGGQGIGTLEDGKKALVWNVLPGETVKFTPRKSKSSYVEGVADEIIDASPDRAQPKDDLYLSTSPWQMMVYKAENKYKQEILAETLQRAGVVYHDKVGFNAPEKEWNYRNKMEYSFFGDDDGLHLALYNRGTHRKQIVRGSSIARPEIDETANKICQILNDKKVRAGDLKSLIVRCDQRGETVAAIFTRNDKFPHIVELADTCKGLGVFFSNPKSPASVLTRELHVYGDLSLQDILLDKIITYNAVSFFQVNLEIYEMALRRIKEAVGDNDVTDMYAGAGSIGLTVAQHNLRLVEIDEISVKWAEVNAASSYLKKVEIIHSPSEKALDYIPTGDGQVVIFDPPRAGLHERVVEKTLEAKPQKIVYLSCNPSTLARDLALLQSDYNIKSLEGYNFFPRTPHIEALAILEKKT